MKKLFALVLSALVAAACAAPTETTNTSMPANANMAKETKPAGPSEAEASTKEKAAWDAVKNKDYEGFGAMLASDYMEVSADTVYDKAGSLNAIKDVVITEAAFSDWKLLPIDKDAFLITYTVNAKGSFKGKAFPSSAIRASSAWVDRNGKWLAIYHQETEVKPQAPPPAATTAKAKPSTSPAVAASPVTTGPDPVANEKAIWSLLKAGNFDGFASLLAPESLEVEPDGVYDKAESIREVAKADFSKFEISDFKPLKFDEDASLVTYKVSSTGATKPIIEQHTTIWVDRGGKWLALYHQGTPRGSAAPVEKTPATK